MKDHDAGNISRCIKPELSGAVMAAKWGGQEPLHAVFMVRRKRSNTAKGTTKSNTSNGALSAQTKAYHRHRSSNVWDLNILLPALF